MTRIVKRDGRIQEYERAKLIDSVQRAGARSEVARAIAGRVMPLEREGTCSIRIRVLMELAARDSAAAENYAATRVLHARRSTSVRPGRAQVNPVTALVFGWRPGMQIVIWYRSTQRTVRVDTGTRVLPSNIQLNPATIRALQAVDGTRVCVSPGPVVIRPDSNR